MYAHISHSCVYDICELKLPRKLSNSVLQQYSSIHISYFNLKTFQYLTFLLSTIRSYSVHVNVTQTGVNVSVTLNNKSDVLKSIEVEVTVLKCTAISLNVTICVADLAHKCIHKCECTFISMYSRAV